MTFPPRYVTLISKDYSHARIVRLVGQGPKNYKGYSAYRGDAGEETEGYLTQYEKARYRLVEGKRWDVEKAIRRAWDAHEKARAEYGRAQERALWEFRDAWREAHPYPVAKTIEEILRECGVAP